MPDRPMHIPSFPGATGAFGRKGDYITIGGGGAPEPRRPPPIVVIPPDPAAFAAPFKKKAKKKATIPGAPAKKAPCGPKG